ncbi:hypothetical protein GLOIN_2v1765994 [Rhizophagus irregularis DAOM 181602=DAOM 197198]|uniref:Retrotransposon gag domain-containing protein n=1 Tax=Rhizophagus irregularis (strain DAOM 197198w) TaxID=1432141 RepID=A0A015L700_RHIIW|nr:hypothetical protein RirG_106130 [Rhizophagus irregularis DAOM 197198w]GET67359.1 hypothetical protein GLOIN_2v1765994 [Rhizophagus irregularis DAOM 181602=DAOM 197198]
MRYFKEILHLEENIIKDENRDKVRKFQKNINYQWSNNYVKPWKDNDLTDKIIGKLIETKGFIKEYDNIEELVSSNEEDNISENLNEKDEIFEMIIRNYWLENDYEIDIEEIKRIISFGVNNEIIKTKEFMSFYKTIEELDDKGIEEELRIWHYMYTIECPICNKIILKKEAIEVVEYNKEFIEKICKSCYEKELENSKNENELNNETEIEKRLEQLKNLIKVLEIEVSDGELLKLISMEYRDVDIVSADFIKLFQEYKNKLEKEIKRILDEYLKRFRIEESEEEVEEENNDTDDSEKIEEILDPEEHEIWKENTEGFDENEFESENKNIINTEGFGLSQNSNSNNKDSDNESEISDYNLQDLFQENILLNMANQDQIKRIIENALEFTPNALDNALGAGQTLANRIQTAGMGGIVVSGRPEGNVGAGACRQNKANIAITCLRGIALQWYNKEKERIAANLVNWYDHDDDRNLRSKLINRFTREDVKRRKMIELTRIKQEKNESIEEYTRRFRSILRIATRGQALHDMYQVNYYIQGLEPTLGYQVRRSSPTNLNDAINIARREEEARSELVMKTMGLNIGQVGQEKNMEEILKEETNKYRKENEIHKKM